MYKAVTINHEGENSESESGGANFDESQTFALMQSSEAHHIKDAKGC